MRPYFPKQTAGLRVAHCSAPWQEPFARSPLPGVSTGGGRCERERLPSRATCPASLLVPAASSFHKGLDIRGVGTPECCLFLLPSFAVQRQAPHAHCQGPV